MPPRFSDLRYLHAGDSIGFTADSRTVYLHPNRSPSGGASYLLASPVPFTPGSGVRFEIPGARNGFPAATFSAISAPAITSVSPIPAQPPPGQALSVRWEPPGDDSSRFELALQYNAPGTAVLTRQVLCQWTDDGSQEIPAELLTEWIAAEVRAVEVSRFRTSRQYVGSAVLFFLATFDTTPPVTP